MAAALGHCSWCSWFCPRLDWLDVDMGDILSSVSVGVESPSYDDEPFALYGLFPLLVPPRSESSAPQARADRHSLHNLVEVRHPPDDQAGVAGGAVLGQLTQQGKRVL